MSRRMFRFVGLLLLGGCALTPFARTPLVPATLQNRAGIVGAALHAARAG